MILLFKEDELNTYVKSNISSSMDSISSSITLAGNLNCPSSFQYASTVNGIQSFLRSEYNNLQEIKSWIDTSALRYKQIDDSIVLNLNTIRPENMKNSTSKF